MELHATYIFLMSTLVMLIGMLKLTLENSWDYDQHCHGWSQFQNRNLGRNKKNNSFKNKNLGS
ncbi:unnamed protein product [Brassica oleracea var. botrytis]